MPRLAAALLELLNGSASIDDWVASHALGGDLEPVWREEATAGELLQLVAFGRDRRAVCNAALACVREVVQMLGANGSAMDRAIDVSEQWVAGKADPDARTKAVDALKAWSASERLESFKDQVVEVLEAAAEDKMDGYNGLVIGQEVDLLPSEASFASIDDEDESSVGDADEFEANVRSRLVAIVRRLIPAPALWQVAGFPGLAFGAPEVRVDASTEALPADRARMPFLARYRAGEPGLAALGARGRRQAESLAKGLLPI